MHTSTKFLSKAEVKTLVDAELLAYFNARKEEAIQIGPRYEALWNTLSQLVLAGGKRFRPYMIMLAFSAYSDDEPRTIMKAAIAQELLHSAMLIHDDIIDRDDTRYGVKNIFGQYQSLYAPLVSDPMEKYHYSVSAALLAGDALLSDAHAALWQLPTTPERTRKAHDIFSKAVRTVIGGELIDTEAAILPKGVVLPHQIALSKTASYSFVSPLLMGAVLAGAPESELSRLRTIAENVGVAYQLRDDLLGVFGDESQTGKSTASDIREGKYSTLVEVFESTATIDQKAIFAKAFKHTLATPEELEAARSALKASGADTEIERLIQSLRETALQDIQLLNLAPEARQALEHCIHECLERTY